MIFNTLPYFLLFLLPSALLFRYCPLSWRPYILSLSGAAFFVFFSVTTPIGGWYGAACLLMLLWQSFCCIYICRPGNRFRNLFVIVQAIVMLAIFKYLNFFGGLIFGKPQDSPFYWAEVFLPLGISFFTFEFIHYAADQWRGKIEKRPSFAEFLSFILFFPTMVAGPIKRVQDFMPKIYAPSESALEDFSRGSTRILVGLAKKFAIADLLTSLTNHLTAADITQATNRGVLILWLFAYGIKIYFDFSAYSDIAIGSARLFGIRVPENFDAPYLASNIGAFWNRWHISLSRWLFDYLYVALGGSRVKPVRIYLNLMTVMLVSGLWHGAGLNFIVWGGYHGILLAIHRMWSRRTPVQKGEGIPENKELQNLAGWAVTFVLVNAGWSFFAMDFSTAMLFWQKLILGTVR